jgi:hypothetical protein
MPLVNTIRRIIGKHAMKSMLFFFTCSASSQDCYRVLGAVDKPGQACSVFATGPQKYLVFGYGEGFDDADFVWYRVENCVVTDSGSFHQPGLNYMIDAAGNAAGEYALCGYHSGSNLTANLLLTDAFMSPVLSVDHVDSVSTYFQTTSWHLYGGVVCGGYRLGAFGQDVLVAKYTVSGLLEWTYTVETSPTEYVQALKVDPANGDIVLAIDRQRPSGDYEIMVTRLTHTGNHVWTTVVSPPHNTGSQNLTILSDGTIMVCGEGASASSANFDFVVASLTSAGDSLDFKSYTIHPSQGDAAFDIRWLGWGKFLLAGYGHNGPGKDLTVSMVDTSGTIHETWFSMMPSLEIAYGLDLSGNEFAVCGVSGVNGINQAVFASSNMIALGLDEHVEPQKDKSLMLPRGSVIPEFLRNVYWFEAASGRRVSDIGNTLGLFVAVLPDSGQVVRVMIY